MAQSHACQEGKHGIKGKLLLSHDLQRTVVKAIVEPCAGLFLNSTSVNPNSSPATTGW